MVTYFLCDTIVRLLCPHLHWTKCEPQGLVFLFFFSLKFKAYVKLILLWLCSWCYKILHMPWQHSCHAMCKILLWSFNRNSDDRHWQPTKFSSNLNHDGEETWNEPQISTAFFNWMMFQYKDPNNKVHGAYMGPTWGRQDPGWPHVGPVNLAIRECLTN